ncbi:short-chain dehydrogenase [Evansella sp. AB-P1]|uniref:short-chain dehydrogenase n=1 Tax=Evansella sp. AB-P1 TaxID=3037653 RepID=UPI00241F4DD3|nr:short-chain dehydrogenase [Evansella sp. AB-P1]MDG5788400.1 short-chain dehydrogenase [Evansella sp. AB-P1]
MKHALIVGGTGMLSDVSLSLVEEGYHVSIVARNSSRMNQLIKASNNGSRITPVFVDYRNSDELRKNVKDVLQKNGPVEIIITWIHSVAKNALDIIMKEASNQNKKCYLYHIVGSSTDLKALNNKVAVPNNCSYHHIKLGFSIENKRSRWLTQEEISNGVIEAIHSNKCSHIVGVIEPWDKRP